MSSTDALVLLLFYLQRLVENETLFGANPCNLWRQKEKSYEISMDEKHHIPHFPSQGEQTRMKKVDVYKEELGTK